MRENLSRAAVVSAARDLLVSEGLTGLSLRRLAARLDVTAAALYAYVDNKRDLLQAVVEMELERLVEEFESVSDGNPVERVCRMSWTYIRYAQRNPTVFQTLFAVRGEAGRGKGDDDFAMVSRAFENARRPLLEAIQAGYVRTTDPVLAHMTLWTAVHGAATLLLRSPSAGDDCEREVPRMVVDSMVRGLCTPEGVALLDQVQCWNS